jgi:hypothetical protein
MSSQKSINSVTSPLVGSISNSSSGTVPPPESKMNRSRQDGPDPFGFVYDQGGSGRRNFKQEAYEAEGAQLGGNDAYNSSVGNEEMWYEIDRKITETVFDTVHQVMQEKQCNGGGGAGNDAMHNNPGKVEAELSELIQDFLKVYCAAGEANRIGHFHSMALQTYTAQLLFLNHYPPVSLAFARLLDEPNLVQTLFRSDTEKWRSWLAFHQAQLKLVKQKFPQEVNSSYHVSLWENCLTQLLQPQFDSVALKNCDSSTSCPSPKNEKAPRENTKAP